MSVRDDFQQLILRIEESNQLPSVARLLLPPLHRNPAKADEFGFLILEDGSIGPFYVSLGQTLPRLHQIRGRLQGEDTLQLAKGLGSANLPVSALALGAINALSQHLMRVAGFDPVALPKGVKAKSHGRLGMVGYFPPLAERYLEQGRELVVIEKNTARVPQNGGITLSTSPDALAKCSQVICTASTLINDSLDEIIAALAPGAELALTGPSASCLPDPLFAAGVTTVGGSRIARPDDLAEALASGGSWSECGEKYQLQAADYPGLERLLATARNRTSHMTH